MEKIVIEMTSTGTLVIAVFGAVFCFMQTKYSTTSRVFATFLAVVAVNNLPDAFAPALAQMPIEYRATLDFFVWPSSFFLAPMFWIYVFVVTSPDQRLPARLARHFVMPGLAVLLGLAVLVAPSEVRVALFTHDGDADSLPVSTLMFLLGFFLLAVLPQIAFYLVLIIRRLIRFRLKLRDVYASTEQHELRWIFVIGGLALLFWLGLVLLLLFEINLENSNASPAISIVSSLAGFLLVAALVLWGLRQRPPLVPVTDEEKTPDTGSVQTASKYEKSALSAEASARLGRKLRGAMESEHLYRDPNLSLWALAKHIGASPNYISQALNEEIGESFFDFVNGYRIAEAMVLLKTTDDSVLTITYDVGFNARSSFYNAFKRVTGQTPSSYRKTNVSA